ncbi:hypothetical protein LCGC14_2309370, partial [marine sediment metagenome]
ANANNRIATSTVNLVEFTKELADVYVRLGGFLKEEKVIEQLSIDYQSLNDVIADLAPTNQLLLNTMTGIGSAMAQAAIHSQSLGEAFVSAIKSMLAQLAASALLFGFLELILPGAGVLGGSKGLISFLGGGDLNLSPSVQPNAGGNQTTVVFQNATFIGTDEQIIRDQLVPILNRVMANA